MFLNCIQSADVVVLLDEKGKEMTSREFSLYLDKKMVTVAKNLIFVIGGPYGFSQEMYNRANEKLSLSKMTFSHEMIRMFFIVLFGLVSAANQILSNTIQTYGYTMFSAMNSVFGVLVFRVIWMAFVYPYWTSFTSLMACFLVSWVITLIINIVGYLVITSRYKKGIARSI